MSRDSGARRFNIFMALFFAAMLLAIAAMLYSTQQQDTHNERAAKEYLCSLANTPNTAAWQNCLGAP